jgi:hypothetical protein
MNIYQQIDARLKFICLLLCLMPLLAWASSRPFDDLILIENEWHQFEGLWAGELIWKDVDPDTIDPKTTKRLNDWKTFQDKYVSHVSSGDRCASPQIPTTGPSFLDRA